MFVQWVSGSNGVGGVWLRICYLSKHRLVGGQGAIWVTRKQRSYKSLDRLWPKGKGPASSATSVHWIYSCDRITSFYRLSRSIRSILFLVKTRSTRLIFRFGRSGELSCKSSCMELFFNQTSRLRLAGTLNDVPTQLCCLGRLDVSSATRLWICQ